MSSPPASGTTDATSPVLVVDLPARIVLEDTRPRVLLTVGPLEGGEHGAVVVLGAVVAVAAPSGYEGMVFAWRAVAGPGEDLGAPLRRIASANLWGPERLFLFGDTEELPPGASRRYQLEAKAEMPSGAGVISAARAIVGAVPMGPRAGASPPSGP